MWRTHILVCFVSHALSSQATRWGIMELELYALVYCSKQLSPYLLGRFFTVRTDHRNLLYLANSTVSKLVRWRVLLSEYNFTVKHIAGKANIVTDGLTRLILWYNQFSVLKQSLHEDDTLSRIFRLEGKDEEYLRNSKRM
jgi:RNase H-like domain found in reverse transcriptase